MSGNRRSSRFSNPGGGDELYQAAMEIEAAEREEKREKRRLARERLARAASEFAKSTVDGEPSNEDEGEDVDNDADAEGEDMDVDEQPEVLPGEPEVNSKVPSEAGDLDRVSDRVESPLSPVPSEVGEKSNETPPPNPDIYVDIPRPSSSKLPKWQTNDNDDADDFVPDVEDELDESEGDDDGGPCSKGKAGSIFEGEPFELPIIPDDISPEEFGEEVNGVLMTKWRCPLLGVNANNELVGIEAGYPVPMALRFIVDLGIKRLREKVVVNTDVVPSLNRFNAGIRVFANDDWALVDDACPRCEKMNRICFRANRSKALCVGCNLNKYGCTSRALDEKTRPLVVDPEVIRRELPVITKELEDLHKNLGGSLDKGIDAFGVSTVHSTVGRAVATLNRISGVPAPVSSRVGKDLFVAFPMDVGRVFLPATTTSLSWKSHVILQPGEDIQDVVDERYAHVAAEKKSRKGKEKAAPKKVAVVLEPCESRDPVTPAKRKAKAKTVTPASPSKKSRK